MIRLIDVHKSFGAQTVLNGLNLMIPAGQITAIIGPSGEGKSVLIKQMIGLMQPDRGRIEVDGERIDFRAGETIRLFFSYRYTPERVWKILARHGLEICGQWIAKSGEEGVFLCSGAL